MSFAELLEKKRQAARERLQPSATNSAPTFGEALEAMRQAHGLTQREFSVLLGISDRHYPEIVRGDRAVSMALARRAYALGIAPEVILG